MVTLSRKARPTYTTASYSLDLCLFLFLTLSPCLISTPTAIAVAAADPISRDQLYSQGGFIKSWIAPMPKTPVVAAGSGSGTSKGNSSKVDMDGEKFLVQNWSTTYHKIAIGGNDISFVPDPFASNGDNNTVLQLNYPKGSYVPSMGPVAGGTHFYANPFGDQTPFTKMMVSYDVAFPNGFDWVLGGKLPGIYGGSPYDGCSGGVQSTGENCLTVRLMWRQSGLGEVYAYIPADSKSSFCNTPEVMCNDKYGKSVGRGLVYFIPGKWTRLDMVMALNEPAGRHNGILQVYMNGNLVLSMDNVPYRSTGMVGFQGLMFSSFFGGSDPEYATPVNTSVYFRNVQLSVGEPAQLYNGTGGSASGRVVGSRGTAESMFYSLFALFMVLVLV